MVCQYLGKCGGCAEITLESKIHEVSLLLGIQNFAVFSSCDSAFRARAELGVYHLEDKIHFAMRGNGENLKSHFVCIENCPNLASNIQKALPLLQCSLNNKAFETLKTRLFSLEILSTQTNALLLTLIYHKKLEESWKKDAEILRQKLQRALNLEIHLIGRSKGIKLIVGKDYLTESLTILGKNYFYRYDEGAFTQPNPLINSQMIAWILQHLKNSNSCDLLEMYCGCGNFTIPLARKFRRVLATEISKTSIKAAQFATQQNKTSNVHFVRLSGMECIEALQRTREFRRLNGIDLDSFNFGAVLVDPPRAGLGGEVCNFLQQFPMILYISCNPLTLKQDLETLKQTHEITHTAFFDQFPHTKHLESIVILQKQKFA
ncbi:tRNA (uridine(54)-C5)-methyltransferase TrmA [Helicobacter sp. MIT 05-5294]|uniref:tRNA (uridine(54)-C5)-methyltransferase TrmA n=1 Tax=Helicobacter sp. MIT 05-5294 TaxID=1548150 RepID=UPI0010FE4AB4|nr:tRNA (uridine(54)-C5)-methyltransferase TrmA [Helicobacter sp. MIT 05-5294]TLD87516.1 tRNA (uridine(54)-C5)-methyltransferase TrmA [Helicobacter sp. MIT 05-5294]